MEPTAISWDQGTRAREGLSYQLISCVVLATGQQTKAKQQPRSHGSAPGPSIIHGGPASGVAPLSGALISRANQPHVNYSPRLAFPQPVPGLCFSLLLSLPAKICVCLSVLLLGQKAGLWLWPCLRTRHGCAGGGISQQAGHKPVANPFIFRTWSSLLLVDSCRRRCQLLRGVVLWVPAEGVHCSPPLPWSGMGTSPLWCLGGPTQPEHPILGLLSLLGHTPLQEWMFWGSFYHCL